MPEERTKTFVRDSTGLVKSVSFLDAVTLNISNMSAGAALATIAFTVLAVPSGFLSGMNLVYGAIIAFILSIPQIVVYTMMSRRLPRTGGDYVWVSRTFGGLFGSSLSFMGYSMETLAYLALIALSAVSAIGSVLVTQGYLGYLSIALPPGSGGDPTQVFLVGAIIFAILVAINIFKPKVGYKLVSALVIIGIFSVIVAILALLSAGQTGVANYMQNFAGVNATYSQVSNSYVSSFGTSTFNFSSTLFLLPFFAIFVFPWLNASPAVASEVKGKNALRWNIPVSALIVFAIVAGSFATMYYVGGYSFINGALSNYNLVILNTFNFWTLAMGVSGNVWIAWLIGLGWILWELAILAYGIIVISRYLFAQSFDRFLPSKISYVSPKYGSPVVAHLIDLVITIALIGFVSYFYGSLQTLFAAVIAAMIYFFFVGISAVIYGSKKERGRSRLTLQVAGILMAIVFAYIIYQFLAYPQVWGTSFPAFGIPGYIFAYIYVAASFVAGLIIYAASRMYHKKRGINIDLAYREIPPD